MWSGSLRLVPGPHTAVSPGNIFSRRLMRLRRMAHTAEVNGGYKYLLISPFHFSKNIRCSFVHINEQFVFWGGCRQLVNILYFSLNILCFSVVDCVAICVSTLSLRSQTPSICTDTRQIKVSLYLSEPDRNQQVFCIELVIPCPWQRWLLFFFTSLVEGKSA